MIMSSQPKSRPKRAQPPAIPGEHGWWIARAAQARESVLLPALTKLGLTPKLAEALHVIREHRSITPSDLSDILEVDRSSAARILRVLEEEGLLKRSVDPANRRFFHISLTARGTSKAEVASDVLERTDKLFMEGMKLTSRANLLTYLRHYVSCCVAATPDDLLG